MIGLLGALGHPGSQEEDFCDWQLSQNISWKKAFHKQRRMPLSEAAETLTLSYFSNMASALWNSSHQVAVLPRRHWKPDATVVPWGVVRFGHS